MKVGDTVVTIKDHSMGCYKKGQIFKIIGEKRGCCKKETKAINIGLTIPFGDNRTQCNFCGDICYDGIFWVNAINFVPIQDVQYKTVTFKEIQEPEICAN